MVNQGIYGALDQYWSVEPKARLHRKNSFFDDVQISNSQALKVGIVASVLVTSVIVFWSIIGVVL